jgi:hypothetical protein
MKNVSFQQRTSSASTCNNWDLNNVKGKDNELWNRTCIRKDEQCIECITRTMKDEKEKRVRASNNWVHFTFQLPASKLAECLIVGRCAPSFFLYVCALAPPSCLLMPCIYSAQTNHQRGNWEHLPFSFFLSGSDPSRATVIDRCDQESFFFWV